MRKTLYISGMSCLHCKTRVENALNAIDGVKACVNLEKGVAEVSLSKDISGETLEKAVKEAGYQIKERGE